jgi:hypothetical protein
MLLASLFMAFSSMFSMHTSVAHAELERSLSVTTYYDNAQDLGFSIQGEIDDSPYACMIQHVVNFSEGQISVITDPGNPLNLCRNEMAADSVELRLRKVSLNYGNYALVVDGQNLGIIQYSEGHLVFVPMTEIPEKQ